MIDRTERDAVDHSEGLDIPDTEAAHTHSTDQYQDITIVKYLSCLKTKVSDIQVQWNIKDEIFSFGWNTPLEHKVNVKLNNANNSPALDIKD